MRNPAAAFIRSLLPVSLLIGGAFSVAAQPSNQVWFVTYNGVPTPSSDVSVQSLATSGGTNTLAAGTAVNSTCQTNFPQFNSPFDIAVDPAMGKVYVLDNNLSGVMPEYIYAFSLTNTPAQVATNAQIIYTMIVPAADSNASVYPLISGLALDASNHFLYFNQIDVTTPTNSFVGRLDLATSSKSDRFAAGATNPAFHAYYTGQIPGQGPIALDATNFYLGAIGRLGDAGVFVAPRTGAGRFSEVVTNSADDLTFSNGLVGGVASDPQDHLVYYLTANAGVLNGKFDLGQNALWAYDTVARTTKKISSGYPGYPDNLAIDSANHRYYFTLGRDGTGNPTPTNYQAIYTGTLGVTNAPTLLYRPVLSGQDAAGQINAGNVVVQGIFVENSPTLASVPASAIYLTGQAPVALAPNLATADPSSTLLAGATVAIAGGSFSGDGDTLSAVTNGTGIAADYDASTATLALSGSDTLADYDLVLRTVAFSSTNSDPTLGGRYPARSIIWTATDGVLASTPITTTLAILPMPPANHVAIAATTSSWFLFFKGAPGQNYKIQFATAVTGPWTDLSPVLTADPTGVIAYNDQTLPPPTTRFYRVRTAP